MTVYPIDEEPCTKRWPKLLHHLESLVILHQLMEKCKCGQWETSRKNWLNGHVTTFFQLSFTLFILTLSRTSLEICAVVFILLKQWLWSNETFTGSSHNVVACCWRSHHVEMVQCPINSKHDMLSHFRCVLKQILRHSKCYQPGNW